MSEKLGSALAAGGDSLEQSLYLKKAHSSTISYIYFVDVFEFPQLSSAGLDEAGYNIWSQTAHFNHTVCSYD